MRGIPFLGKKDGPMRSIAAIAILWASLAGLEAKPSAAAAPKTELRVYIAKVNVQMRTYRAVARRADAAFTQTPPDDYQALARRVDASSREWRQLRTAFIRLKAPRALRAAHAKEVTALGLLAQAFAGLASAQRSFVDSQDLSALSAAVQAAGKQFKRAATLQRAWASSLATALRRARLLVPSWLRAMLSKSDSALGRGYTSLLARM